MNEQANGLVKRFNKTLVTLTDATSTKIGARCTDFLRIYRDTVHAATGVSPSQLFHGRMMCSAFSAVLTELHVPLLTDESKLK